MAAPWYKHYPVDEMSDAGLRMSSLAARGLWREIVNLAHAAEPRGHLLVNGKPPTIKALANLCAATVGEVEACLVELKDNGVYSEIEGVIVCRRMVRDTEKAKRDAENGGLGGNPNLKPKPVDGVNPPVNAVPKPSVDRQDKAQKPEARGQRLDSDSRTRDQKPEREREIERTKTSADANGAGLSLSDFTSIWKKTHLEELNCECSLSVNAKTRDRIRAISQTDPKRISAAAKFHMAECAKPGKFPFNVEPGDFDNFVRHYDKCEVGAIDKHWIPPIGVDGKPLPWWTDECLECHGANADGLPACHDERTHETRKNREQREAQAVAVQEARQTEREAKEADLQRKYAEAGGKESYEARQRLVVVRAGRTVEGECNDCGRIHIRSTWSKSRECLAALEDAAGESPRYASEPEKAVAS